MFQRLLLGQTSRVLRETGASFTSREWSLLGAGSLLSLAACYGVMRLAGVPAEPGFGGSLLAGPAAGTAVAVAVAVVVAGLVIGTVVAGSVGVEAALFCACLGLTGMAVRCGPVRPVLQYAHGRGVLVAMAVECLLLGAVVVAGWAALDRLARAARRSAGAAVPAISGEVTVATLGQKWSTLGATVLVTAVCELILVLKVDPAQALAGVAIASFVGAWAGYQFEPLGEGLWYWMAPTIVGAIGFLVASLAGGADSSGELHGWGAALARPTPLDAAGLGTAMAVLAHWSSRRSAPPDEAVTEAAIKPVAEPEAVQV